ncbi:MAG: sigma-70 family RNA polymerase sigma factor [Armatimonadia bacterium]
MSRSQVQQLVAGSRAGETVAFDQLVSLYKASISAFVAHRLCDPLEAEDIAQETFFRAYRSLPSFQGSCSFYTWLRCIAGNLTTDAMRRRQRLSGTLSLDAPLEFNGEEVERELAGPLYYQPEMEVETAELQREVHRAVQDLTPKLRTVVVLYELQGLTYRQIAMEIGCPVGTVRSRMFNARNQLKRRLLQPKSRDVLAASFGPLGEPGRPRTQRSRLTTH